MDEGDLHPPSPPSGLFVYKLDAVAFQFRQGAIQVVDLESDVVEAFAAFGQELPDRRVRTRGLDQLYRRFAHPEHGCYDALLLDHLRLTRRGSEVLPVELRGGFDVLDRVAEMIDPVEHTSPSCRTPTEDLNSRTSRSARITPRCLTGGEHGAERFGKDRRALRGARAAPGKGGCPPCRRRRPQEARTDRPRPAGPMGPQAQGTLRRDDRPRR